MILAIQMGPLKRLVLGIIPSESILMKQNVSFLIMNNPLTKKNTTNYAQVKTSLTEEISKFDVFSISP